ncbi:MAG: hypothetical protein K6G80_00070 [Treponema sp.]|nr:hypothetical protein [Treponema sp.]
MAAVSWPYGVNMKAYNATDGAVENTIELEFESGKTRTYNKNTRSRRAFSFNICCLNNNTASCEYVRFWTWWCDVLKGGANTFYFTDLLTKTGLTEYRMTSTPSATGQRYKEITIEVEEV